MKRYTLAEITRALDGAQNMPYALYENAREKAIAAADGNPAYRWVRPLLTEYVKQYEENPVPPVTYQQYAAWDRRGERDADAPMYAQRTRLNRMWLAALMGIEGGREQCENALYDYLHLPTWSLTAHLLDHGAEDYWDIPVGPYDETGRIRGIGRNRKQSLDLCSCSGAAILAEMAQTLEGIIDPCLIRWARQECFERVLSNFMSLAPFPHFEINPNNWSGVCMSSIGIAAIYLITDTHTLAPVIMRVLESLRVHESGYNDDGASPEGFGYWQYGFEYYLMFIDLLKKRTGGKIDLLQDEKLRRVAGFGTDCCFGKTLKLPFGDCNWRAVLDEAVRRYVGALGVSVVPQGDTQESFCAAWEHGNLMLRHLIWDMCPTGDAVPETRSSVYPVNQMYMAACGNGIFTAVKGGNNGESHNHNDVGAFTVARDDHMIIADPAGGKYCKDYFNDAKRYTFFATRSGGHSVPLVDGIEQEGNGSCRAKSFEADTGERIDRIRIDLTGTLKTPKLTKLLREMTVDRETGKIELTDEFVLTEEAEIRDRLITAGLPEPAGSGKLRLDSLIIGYGEDLRYEINDSGQTIDDGKPIYTLDFIPVKTGPGKTEIRVSILPQ